MRFTQFKEFKEADPNTGTLETVISYLFADMPKTLRELSYGLTKLTFADNFESFKVSVTIPATSELAIRNQLRSGQIPTERIIVRGKSGAENVVDGDTDWTKQFVYLKNVGASAATVTVLFIRA